MDFMDQPLLQLAVVGDVEQPAGRPQQAVACCSSICARLGLIQQLLVLWVSLRGVLHLVAQRHRRDSHLPLRSSFVLFENGQPYL